MSLYYYILFYYFHIIENIAFQNKLTFYYKYNIECHVQVPYIFFWMSYYSMEILNIDKTHCDM